MLKHALQGGKQIGLLIYKPVGTYNDHNVMLREGSKLPGGDMFLHGRIKMPDGWRKFRDDAQATDAADISWMYKMCMRNIVQACHAIFLPCGFNGTLRGIA